MIVRAFVFALLALCGCAREGAVTLAGRPDRGFLEKHCLGCHDADDPKGKLDLSRLALEPGTWVKIHDRVRDGEMPPPEKKKRPEPGELADFLQAVAAPLVAADLAKEAVEGRSTWRRLNRYEYENSLRDLLQAPWLRIKDMLPEDGEAHRFNKVGDALDISHVQMAQYLAAAEYALREVIATSVARPETTTTRYYARDMGSFTRKMKFNEFNTSPDRATFPTLGFAAQPEVRKGTAPMSDPNTREEEGVGLVAGAYEPVEPRFDGFKAPRSGRYKVRLRGHSIWLAPGKTAKWWVANLDEASKGRRSEPVTLYSEAPPRMLRRLGAFDLHPDPTTAELDTVLLKGESIRPDASRLFRSRPPNWRNPLAQPDGVPGVTYRWLEVEGPFLDAWPPAGHALLFGNLPFRETPKGVEVVEAEAGDVDALLRGFLARAYRRPAAEADVARFRDVVTRARAAGLPFADAMIAGYSAALCSPGFVCLEEKPGRLDRDALASRLSYFLWNSPPDEALRSAKDPLAHVDRLLADPRSGRFVEAFLDYWVDLRRVDATSPDAELYPDYYLDDHLQESAVEETRAFFAELLRADLPARTIVASDFAMLNERLALHYGVPGVEGVAIRKVKLPAGSPRGGLLTQASVLKVTANGTTTSPVVRGVWVMERVLGKPPPPPPPSVPAVEPDIRGAATIREQLDKHRSDKTCAACHVKIDPAGFALESFDVLGGWRERYRALGEGTKAIGFGKNGQPFAFHPAQPVDASGTMPGGGAFRDVVELKAVLLKDERQIARNLASQLIVYATGAPVRFGDRARLEAILDRAAPAYGVGKIVREIVQSELFQRK
ncbi:MAG TPA: DUF1588 domain-containing protein [Planctomycetota bacterium]